MRQATGLGRIFRGAFATRGASIRAKGSGAPSQSRFARLGFAALAVAALLALATSAAFSAEVTEHVKGFGPDGTESSDFERINGVGLDQQTGNVFVLDGLKEALYKFDADGQPLPWAGSNPNITGNRIAGISSYDFRDVAQVAVDSTSHVVYVTEEHAVRAFQQDGEPAEFTSGPGMGTNAIPGFAELYGVATDANGNIYASDLAGTVSVYAPSGELLTSFAFPNPANLAVAPSGVVYIVGSGFGPSGVYKFVPSEFPVTAATTYSEGPKLATTNITEGVGVDPLKGEIYVITTDFGTAWIRKYDSSGAFVGLLAKSDQGGELEDFAQGIAVLGGGDEHQFYVGNTEAFGDPTELSSKVEIFGEVINPGPPSVEAPWATDVSADSAVVHTRINPNTAATTYRFEYGLGDCAANACASVPLGGAGIGSGHHPVAVSQLIAGLQGATTYHYRVVAQNSFDPLDPVESPDSTFTTQFSGLGFELTDRRAWEMVSPPDKHGASVILFPRGVQAAEDGNGMASMSTGSIEAAPQGNRSLQPSPVLSRRGEGGVWSSKDISLPQSHVVGLFGPPEYVTFTPDLSRALVEPRDDAPLSPQASETTPYLREGEPPTFTPLVTSKEGFANVSPGTEFGDQVEPVGFNPSLTDVVLGSHVALTDAPLSAELDRNALYRWSAGQIHPVSELPAGEGGGLVTGVLGSGAAGSRRTAVSEDGPRAFFSTGSGYDTEHIQLTALYLRDAQGEESVRLDVEQPGASGAGEASPVFQGASADGTVVFFTDSRDLTEDSSPEGRDLYRCEIPAGAAGAGCATLTNISAPQPGQSAMVRDLAPAFSRDGSRIYFVAEGVLDSQPNQEGDLATAGEPNFYLWEEGEGVRFIATLAEADETAARGEVGQQNGVAASISAAASPSGRYLAFMSERSLTGYDNREAGGDEPTEQAYRYDAESEELVCISCNPTGASPVGQRFAIVESRLGPKVNRLSLWVGQLMAATLPQANVEKGVRTLSRPRSVLDNGRVFFNAYDSLASADSNGQWDVYQYESTGVGDCTASSGSASVSRSGGGCVSLISSGTASEEAAFMDASATGDDVFFLTPARLSVSDEDDAYDVYDARVDGIPATLQPNNECLGEACQPAALAPNDPTPASAAFKGRGNVKPDARKRCAKGKRQVRRGGKARCVSRKGKKHKRANKSGRASR